MTGTFRNLQVVDRPAMVAAGDARFMKDDEFVVGMVVDEQAYAFPYRQLFNHPVILQPIREKRVALFWSAFANRAMAVHVSRQIYRPRVGSGFDALQCTAGVRRARGAVHQWADRAGARWDGAWRVSLARADDEGDVGAVAGDASADAGDGAAGTGQCANRAGPAAISDADSEGGGVAAADRDAGGGVRDDPAGGDSEKAISDQPINTAVGEIPAVIFRDPASGQVKAFERKYDERSSRFLSNPSPRRASKGVFMLDVATNSGWNTSGVAVDGEADIIGKRLPPIANVEEGLYYGVMREWYPEMELVSRKRRIERNT